MNDKCLTLITTELLETWPSNGDKLFLGEWCDPDLGQDSCLVVPYHWNDREKLKNDFELLQAIRQSISIDLAKAMNSLHGVERSKRYWDLLLGYWLNVFISVIIDRFSSIKSALSYRPNATFIIDTSDEVFFSNDTADFVRLSSESALWNHAVFALILNGLDKTGSVSRIHTSDNRDFKEKQVNSGFKNYLKSTLSNLVFFIKRRDKFYIETTKLPFWELFFLELRLKQIPFIRFGNKNQNRFSYDVKFRNWTLPNSGKHSEVEIFIRQIIPLFVPAIFIEGYKFLSNKSIVRANLSSAKIIFTSTQHFLDDFFKAFAAEKIEHGSRLIIGEHGGLGVGLFNGAHRYELDIADRYLSAGWGADESQKIMPIGNFRIASKKILPNQSGRALLVCGNMPKFNIDIRSMTLSSQMIDYFEDQFKFMESLPGFIKESTTVRLYQLDYGWKQELRWRINFPNVLLDRGKNPIWEIAHKYRIVIATYNATTLIESLFFNFPTIIFWDPKFWEIKSFAKDYFDRLKKVGIFHENPESAAKHLVSIWGDINGWWYSKSVQEARNYFSNKYCTKINGINSELAKVLLQESRFAF